MHNTIELNYDPVNFSFTTALLQNVEKLALFHGCMKYIFTEQLLKFLRVVFCLVLVLVNYVQQLSIPKFCQLTLFQNEELFWCFSSFVFKPIPLCNVA